MDDGILTSTATANAFENAFQPAGANGNGNAAAAAALTELSEVQVKFITRNPDLPQVPDTFLNVPVKLARYGLSEIVNALTETDPPRPFDFLIRGQFLRSTLLRYLTVNGFGGAEAGLELEYVEAAPEPESKPSRPHPDWIASIDARGGRGQYVVTGCYDSVVRVFDANQSKAAAIALGVGHASAVKSVAVFRNQPSAVKEEGKSASSLQIVSGSKDRTVRVWKFTPGQAQMKCIAECVAHADSVDAVAVPLGSDLFASGGWDNNVNVWDITNADTLQASDASAEEAPAAKKRKKSDATPAAAATPTYAPLRTMSGHIGAVTSLVYPHPASVYSGAMDHHLKQWDVETGACSNTWFGRQVVTCMDFGLQANVLGTGHHDKMIRIWDPRVSNTTKEVLKLQLRSHKGWVSALKFHPTNAHQLASVSYDHSVKIWDMRASLPLFTLAPHTDKVLACDWMDDTRLWSGGADNQLQTHTMKA